MPIITTLVIGAFASRGCDAVAARCSASHSWPTISAVVRLRLKPCWPVEQNAQSTAQPACAEMHSVPRSVSGMNTVSTALPSPTSSSHLRVPSAAVAVATTIAAPRPRRCSAELARAATSARSRHRVRSRLRRAGGSSAAAGGAKRLLAELLAEVGAARAVEVEQIDGIELRAFSASRRSCRERSRRFRLRRSRRRRSRARRWRRCCGEIGADRALAGLLRIGRAHQLAVLRDRVLAFEHLDHHRAEIMKSTRSLKNGRSRCTA